MPAEAGADDVASLEDVFASRSFGRRPSTASAATLRFAGVPKASRYFVHNRLVAAVAIGAAGLSVVAGVRVGYGPVARHLPGAVASAPGSGEHLAPLHSGTEDVAPPVPSAPSTETVTGLLGSSTTVLAAPTSPMLSLVKTGHSTAPAAGAGITATVASTITPAPTSTSTLPTTTPPPTTPPTTRAPSPTAPTTVVVAAGSGNASSSGGGSQGSGQGNQGASGSSAGVGGVSLGSSFGGGITGGGHGGGGDGGGGASHDGWGDSNGRGSHGGTNTTYSDHGSDHGSGHDGGANW